MYKLSKHILLFLLLLGANSSYGMETDFDSSGNFDVYSPIEEKQEKSFWEKTKKFCNTAKNKIKNYQYFSRKNLSLLGFFGIFSALNGGVLLLHKIMRSTLPDAPTATKNKVIELAKQLKIKNPEKIKVKVNYNPRYNGYSDIFGNIVLSKKTSDTIKNNKSLFIIGHELCHHKKKDALIGYFASIACKLGLYVVFKKLNVFKYLKKKFDTRGKYTSPAQNQGDRQTATHNNNNTQKKKSLWKKSFDHFANFYIPLYIADILVANTIGRFFEKRADLTAASLGKNIAQGGINLFKMLQKNTPKNATYKLLTLKRWFADPHPSHDTRINYLKAFKKATYGGKTLFKRVKHGGKILVKKLLRVG